MEKLQKKLDTTGSRNYKLEDFSGKPVFLDFWASWCPPCRASSPYVERLAEKYEGRAYVIGINLDNSTSDALRFVREQESSILHLYGAGTDVASRFGVTGIPSFFILDPDGRIVFGRSGFRGNDYATWVQILGELVESESSGR